MEPNSRTPASAWMVPILNAVILRDMFVEEGLDPNHLLQGTSLSGDVFEDDDALLPYDKMVKIFQNAAKAFPHPELGLRMGARESPSDWGLVGYAMICCRDARAVFDVIRKFHKVAASMTEMAVQEIEGLLLLRLIPPRPLGTALPVVIEEHITATVAALKFVTGKSIVPERLELSYARPDHYRAYARYFGCPVYFDRAVNQLVFDADILDLPVMQRNDVSAKIAASLCAQQLNRQSIEPDFVYRVRHCLLMRTDRFPTADEVAQQLHMTSRTLRNKLRHDDTSFQSILDDVRKQIALDYLENSTMTVAEIADILGFDSSRNFRRAFMRWTGELPSATRNRRSGSQ